MCDHGSYGFQPGRKTNDGRRSALLLCVRLGHVSSTPHLRTPSRLGNRLSRLVQVLLSPPCYRLCLEWPGDCPDTSDSRRFNHRPASQGGIWRDLLNGNLKETEVDTAMFPFPSDSGVEVGLHLRSLREEHAVLPRGLCAVYWKLPTRRVGKYWAALRVRFVPTSYEELWIARNSGAEFLAVFPGGHRRVLDEKNSSIKARAQIVVRYTRPVLGAKSWAGDI